MFFRQPVGVNATLYALSLRESQCETKVQANVKVDFCTKFCPTSRIFLERIFCIFLPILSAFARFSRFARFLRFEFSHLRWPWLMISAFCHDFFCHFPFTFRSFWILKISLHQPLRRILIFSTGINHEHESNFDLRPPALLLRKFFKTYLAIFLFSEFSAFSFLF